LETLEKVLRQMDKIILDDIVYSEIREQLGHHGPALRPTDVFSALALAPL
jgi:hypothetical protein